MNRILFFPQEISRYTSDTFYKTQIKLQIPCTDYRVQHIILILTQKKEKTENMCLRAGIIEQSMGVLHIEEITKNICRCTYVVEKNEIVSASTKMCVILAHPRPLVLARLIRDLSTFAVSFIFVYFSDMSEKSYLSSSVWKNVKKNTLLGSMQAQNINVVPEVKSFYTLDAALQECDIKNVDYKYCFDTRAKQSFFKALFEKTCKNQNNKKWFFSIGPERGFTENEILTFKKHNFSFYNLGDAVLRTEIASTLVIGSVTGGLG